MSLLHYTVAPEIFDLFPNYVLGVAVFDAVDNTAGPEGLADLLEFRRGEIEVYQQLENLAGDMLEAIAVKPLNGSKRWWEEMPGPHSRFVSAIRRLRDWFNED